MGNKITITEALSEINLITKKLDDKRNAILPALFIASHVIDPYTDNKKYVAQEMQSLTDFQARLTKIRALIQKANLEHNITIGETTKSITEWLAWKKEVATKEIDFLKKVNQRLLDQSMQAQSRPSVYQVQEADKQITKIVEYKYALDLTTVTKRLEILNDIFENLDGQLSLKNATVTIDL